MDWTPSTRWPIEIGLSAACLPTQSKRLQPIRQSDCFCSVLAVFEAFSQSSAHAKDMQFWRAVEDYMYGVLCLGVTLTRALRTAHGTPKDEDDVFKLRQKAVDIFERSG